MIAQKPKFYKGVFLLATFTVVLVIMFSNVFPGPNNTKQNGLNYLDALYNSISKDSANYIPGLKKNAAEYASVAVSATIALADEKQATQTVTLLEKAGAEAKASGKQITVNGMLGQILTACLEDATSMYNNDGQKISTKYGMDERQVVFNWYTALKSLSKDLNHQKKFKEAKVIDTILKKGVELSYNYYKIEPLKISESIGIVSFSLVFYVIYTMWFGFAVLFLFEGWGLKLEH